MEPTTASSPPRRGLLRAAGVPLSVSLAAHGLLLLGLHLLPAEGTAGDDRPLPVNTLVAAEDDAFACTLYTSSPRSSPPDEPGQFSFTVREQPAAPEPARGTAGLGQSASGADADNPPAAAGVNQVGSDANAGGAWPGPALFRVAGKGRSVVYVIDRSLSMGPNNALDVARRELLSSLDQLPESVSFQVIMYNRRAEPLRLRGQTALVPATAVSKEEASALLATVKPEGSTDHLAALRRGLLLQAEVVFLVTDAADMTPAQIQAVTGQNGGRAAIHAIELSRVPGGGGQSGALARLARENRGTYRCVCLGAVAAAPDQSPERQRRVAPTRR